MIRKHSKEHKRKISASVKKSYTKRLRKMRSRQMSGNKHGAGNKGREMDAEWRKKLSEAAKGNTKRRGDWNKDLEAICDLRAPSGNGLWLSLLVNQKIQKAKKRKLKWSITKVEAGKLIAGSCFYCGHKGLLNEMGIDRRDNSIREYTIENCVSCCKYCNSAKQDRSESDFRAWRARIRNKKE